jgi:flotillin
MMNQIVLFVGLGVLVLVFLLGMLAKMYRKAGPNEAIIVYGYRGPRVITGHGVVIFPMVENYRELSLELMSFDVAPQQDLYTNQGVAVTVEAVAQIKVRSDQPSILTAAEQFLSKAPQQREGLIRLVMEGHLRGIIGQLTVEQIVKEPEMVGDRMRNTCAGDMSQDGPGSGLLHHQGSARQERVHLQHGPPGHCPHQARRGYRDGGRRSGIRPFNGQLPRGRPRWPRRRPTRSG